MKKHRKGQDASGSRQRRWAEFEVVRYHVKRNKQRFVDRLNNRITANVGL